MNLGVLKKSTAYRNLGKLAENKKICYNVKVNCNHGEYDEFKT